MALLLAPILVGLIGGGVERFGLRKVHKHGHMAELLFTFGLAYLTVDIVKLIWGKLPVDYKIPRKLDFTLLTVFTTNIHMYKALVIIISILILVGLFLLIRKTKIGMIIQAALFNPIMVNELGHNVSVIFMFVFAIGCAMAGLAGVISGNLFTTDPNMADRLGLIIFVVVIVGGLGSLTGAFAASLLIGLLQTFAASIDLSIREIFKFLPIPLSGLNFLNIKISQTSEILPFILMILILLIRPKGLLGTRET
jgi:branched-chain amino acid transport system permease protein